MKASKKIKRVLIANRGEIAIRIMRTLREMGIESVAVFSPEDKDSLHIRQADYAIELPSGPLANNYLNIPLLLKAIRLSKADAVHPGYGFLSENASFAQGICDETEALFIGPSSHAIELMGDKIKARKLLYSHNIPIVPGSLSPLSSYEELTKLSLELKFPVILKAAGGGGGRGIRVVYHAEDLLKSYEACRREAESYFGNSEVFCEKYIENPRHIEFQILADSFGKTLHLFERDCSIQRRHQKLVEEAPSPFFDEKKRAHYGEIAVKVAQLVNYESAGTVEFIFDNDNGYFMEMNTRIQVEHPVTEQITGIDIVREQIEIAEGKALSYSQNDLKPHGHAIEVRINTEDSRNQFRPSLGKITELHFPNGPFTRVDSHAYHGYELPSSFDSLLAKLIVWGKDREQALQKLRRALLEFHIEGVQTTASFHQALIDHPQFVQGDFSTQFIEQEKDFFVEQQTIVDEKLTDTYAKAVVAALVLTSNTPVFKPSSCNNWANKSLME